MILLTRFTLVGIVGFELAGLFGALPLKPQFSWIGLFLTALFAFGSLTILERYLRNRNQAALPLSLWAMVTAAIILDAGGDLLYLYARFPWYDNLTHFVGGFAIAVLARWFILAKNHGERRAVHPLTACYLVLAAVASIATLYEIVEYFSDWFIGTQNLADRWDTNEDLIMAMIGGFLPAFSFFRRGKKNMVE